LGFNTQIILEGAKNNNALLPVPLLHTIICYGENVLHEVFDNYLEQTINAYMAYKSKADDQFRKWLEVGMDLSDIAQRSISQINPFRAFFDPLPGPKPPSNEKDEE
jgi:polyhydroxyalkanoate synthesis regulator protein